MMEELSGGEAVTTSNRMEITAAIVGLQAVQEPAVITLYADSTFALAAGAARDASGHQIASFNTLVISDVPGLCRTCCSGGG